MKLFVPKSYGYGATPKDWRGWVLILAFALVEGFLAWWLMAASAPPRVVLFLILTAALVVALIVVTKATTEGDWAWRWGGKK